MMPNTNAAIDSQGLSHPAVLENRVTGLETSVKGIKTDVASLAVSLANSHDKLSTQISSLGQNMAASGNTDWKTLTGFGMLLLAIVGGVASLSKAPMDAALIRADGDIREIRRDLVPRSEHEQKWNEQSRREDRIINNILKLREDLYVPRAGAKSKD